MILHTLLTLRPGRRSAAFTTFLVLFGIAATSTRGQPPSDQPRLPTEVELLHAVAEYFRKKPNYRDSDLIARNDCQAVLELLDSQGWSLPGGFEVAELCLPESHVLVRTFETPAGRRFMHKVADYRLIYDRLDRVAGLPGGKQLIQDIVKLPNGEIYAKSRPVAGNPTLTELLPKQRSGRTPSSTNFNKPTGKIYTAKQLLERLEEARQSALQAS